MRKFTKLFLALFLICSSFSAFPNKIEREEGPEDILRISILNNNLFLYLNTSGDQKIHNVVLKLERGKRIKLESAIVEKKQLVFYLDSKEAFKLKKYKVESVAWVDQTGKTEMKLNPFQTEKISRSLP